MRTCKAHSINLQHDNTHSMSLSYVSRLLSVALQSVAIMALALCAGSCNTSRRVTETSNSSTQVVALHADSQRTANTVQQTTIVRREGVRADSLSMTIPLTNLRDLPQGASYTQRKGAPK